MSERVRLLHCHLKTACSNKNYLRPDKRLSSAMRELVSNKRQLRLVAKTARSVTVLFHYPVLFSPLVAGSGSNGGCVIVFKGFTEGLHPCLNLKEVRFQGLKLAEEEMVDEDLAK